jgi:hypothetical protein
VAQVVELLPSKHKALSSNLVLKKKKKKKEKKRNKKEAKTNSKKHVERM